jgi:DNA-directed RNA polymerase subunit beta
MEELTQALSNILLDEKIPLDVVNAETGEIIIPANRKITKTLLRDARGAYKHIEDGSSADPDEDLARSSAEFEASKFNELDSNESGEIDRVEERRRRRPASSSR